MSDASYIKGGSFLIQDTDAADVFTYEDFDSDQLMFAKTARDFMDNEVIPVSDEIEAKNFEVSRDLVSKAGELGLLMADVAEEHGGMGLDKASCALIAASITGQGSFQTMCMAHTGIGTLPIAYYGTEAQRQKYLPGLASGEMIGAYCLTEPSAGSDAMSARTKAVLNEAGTHYVMNGTKQFITNAFFADVFIVFAKIDGEKFTGFLLDKGTPGLSIGPEEHKMGIKGSSTTTVIMEDAQVPVENILGEIGQGHKIAFNILNIGRFKLGIGCVGTSGRALEDSLAYTLERKQFGVPVATFEAIREKLGEMYARIYSLNAMGYRTAGLIDQILAGAEDKYGEAGLQSIEEYSVECAMVKVYGSETADYVTDEAVQCYGGYGFCAEYPVERYYRDNRINRLFEGTNEINRIVVGSMLLRKAAAGQLALFDNMAEAAVPAQAGEGVLAAEKAIVANLKKITLNVMGLAAQKYGKALASKQMVLLRLADLAMTTYVAESTLIRAVKDVEKRGEEAAALAIASAVIICEAAIDQAESLARQCLVAMDEQDALKLLGALVARKPSDALASKGVIAAKIIDMERVVL